MDNLISSTLEFLQEKGAQLLGVTDEQVVFELGKKTVSAYFEADMVTLQVGGLKVSGYTVYSVYPKLVRHLI